MADLERALGEARELGVRDTVERLWHALGGPATLTEARSLEEAEAFFEVLTDAERRDGPALDLASLAQALERLYAPTAAGPDGAYRALDDPQGQGPAVRYRDRTGPRALASRRRTTAVAVVERRSPPTTRDSSWRRVRRPVAGRTCSTTGSSSRSATDFCRSDGGSCTWLRPARSWLHLIGSCALRVGGIGTELRRPPSASMLGMLWPAVCEEFTAQLCTAMCRRVTSTKRLRVIRRCAGCRRNGERRRPRPRRG